MKELYCRTSGDIIEYIFVEGNLPYARGFCYPDSLDVYDVIAAVPESRDKKLGFFFSQIGDGKRAFCDDNMPKAGNPFPCMITALPSGTKSFEITPVISFTGLFVHADFIPEFSRKQPGSGLAVSKKITNGRGEAIKTFFAEKCAEIRFPGYSFYVMFRTLCDMPEVSFSDIAAELDSFVKRFGEILVRCGGNGTLPHPGPGTVLYKQTLPEHIGNCIRKNDISKIVTDDPVLSLQFSEYFERMPEAPQVLTRPDFDRLFDTVDGLRKLPAYLGRTFFTRSGARIVYDRTEAMHVFDINSFESDLSALDVNLECCDTLARVISVQNLTGIIMIDFINMNSPEDYEKVLKRMKELALLDFRPFIIYNFTRLKVLEASRSK